MKNLGKYRIYLTGSKKYISRCVYKTNDFYFIKFYGKMIEVKKSQMDFYTIESY